MRRRRTIYFNDARHYYLFVFEPPMRLEEAHRPVDECAGTAVDTFVYGVARDEGLFYPSKVGKVFKYGTHESDVEGFNLAAYWRLWHNMQGLIDRGLDPLTVLIDRAHEKGMEFIASLRLGGPGNLDAGISVAEGGRGFAEKALREHKFEILRELAHDYATDGIELDLSAPPGGSAPLLREEDVSTHTDVLTQWVCAVSEMVRTGRDQAKGIVGARVYPTEQANLNAGYDVRAMLAAGALDYVTPMVYGHHTMDVDMPMDWLIGAAHEADVSVYPMIQPNYTAEGGEGRDHHRYATPAMMRAAAANYWEAGADGMATWFLPWPLQDAGRRILGELGDPDLVREADKHYVVRRYSKAAEHVGYAAPLPVEIPFNDPGTRYPIPFTLADDLEGATSRVCQVRLRIRVRDLVAQDRITFFLNGRTLAGEACLRSFGAPVVPYEFVWLDFHLRTVLPHKGKNLLEIVLDGRPEGLISPLTIQDVEVIVTYGAYGSTGGNKEE